MSRFSTITVRWFPPRRYRSYQDYIWEGFRARNATSGKMSFSRSSDLILSYRQNSNPVKLSKDLPGRRTIYENLHSSSRKLKLLKVYAALFGMVLVLVGPPALNLYQILQAGGEKNRKFSPILRNPYLISSPLPMYDSVVDSLFAVFQSKGTNEEFINFTPKYQEFWTPEMGLYSKQENDPEFSYSQLEAAKSPAGLLVFFKILIGSILALYFQKRLMRPVRLHDCRFKSGQLQKLELLEKKGKTVANLSYYTPLKYGLSAKMFKRFSEVKYDFMTQTKYNSIMATIQFDVNWRTMPHLYPKSKEGFLAGNSPFAVDKFLIWQKDVDTAEIPLKDFVITKVDENFKNLLIAVSEEQGDLESEISFTQQLYMNSLRNYYIKRLLDSGFGELFEDLQAIKRTVFQSVPKDQSGKDLIVSKHPTAQIVSVPKIGPLLDIDEGYLEAFVKV